MSTGDTDILAQLGFSDEPPPTKNGLLALVQEIHSGVRELLARTADEEDTTEADRAIERAAVAEAEFAEGPDDDAPSDEGDSSSDEHDPPATPCDPSKETAYPLAGHWRYSDVAIADIGGINPDIYDLGDSTMIPARRKILADVVSRTERNLTPEQTERIIAMPAPEFAACILAMEETDVPLSEILSDTDDSESDSSSESDTDPFDRGVNDLCTALCELVDALTDEYDPPFDDPLTPRLRQIAHNALGELRFVFDVDCDDEVGDLPDPAEGPLIAAAKKLHMSDSAPVQHSKRAHMADDGSAAGSAADAGSAAGSAADAGSAAGSAAATETTLAVIAAACVHQLTLADWTPFDVLGAEIKAVQQLDLPVLPDRRRDLGMRECSRRAILVPVEQLLPITEDDAIPAVLHRDATLRMVALAVECLGEAATTVQAVHEWRDHLLWRAEVRYQEVRNRARGESDHSSLSDGEDEEGPHLYRNGERIIGMSSPITYEDCLIVQRGETDTEPLFPTVPALRPHAVARVLQDIISGEKARFTHEAIQLLSEASEAYLVDTFAAADDVRRASLGGRACVYVSDLAAARRIEQPHVDACRTRP